MSKKQVHNSRSHISNLKRFLEEHVGFSSCFNVSDVKGDGAVFVRFRSWEGVSATEFSRRFCVALDARKLQYEQTTEVQFRLDIAGFVVQLHSEEE